MTGLPYRIRFDAWVMASYSACSQMPTEAKPRLNLPTFTVFSAAWKAALPVCSTSASVTGYSSSSNWLT